jgi:hypothetical protein
LISYKKKTFSLAVQIITDKKKKTFYSNDFPPVVGSDLHSKLKGGIRTSIDVPSSFSILKVPHICPLGADNETWDEY